MAHDVFISYSSKDQKIVEGLLAYLEQNGVRCFVAFRDIPPGEPWPPKITVAIRNCKLMVLVFSEQSNDSEHVENEIVMCKENRKPIITFKLEDANYNDTLYYYLIRLHHIDAFPNPEDCFGRLCEAIKKLINIEPPVHPPKPPPLPTQNTSSITEYIKNKITLHFANSEETFIDILSGDIQRKLNIKDKTSQVCNAMRYAADIYPHQVIETPPKGIGTRLKIRYYKNAADKYNEDYWIERSSKESMDLMNRFKATFPENLGEYDLRYNKVFIGLSKNNKANNFVWFAPQKNDLVICFVIDKTEDIDNTLDKSGLPQLTYDKQFRTYKIKIRENDLKDNRDILNFLVKTAYDNNKQHQVK